MIQSELADLMQKGLSTEHTVESVSCFLEDIHGQYYVCALGAMIVGKFGDAKIASDAVEEEKYGSGKDDTVPTDYLNIAIRLLEIDSNLAQAIDQTHMLGTPADVIIQRLRQGTFLY
jgi:hypothetical protein